MRVALNRYPRNDTSSNAETALRDATRALAGRPGTRAVLLLTDADTASYGDSPELWQDFDATRPRVFAVHIGTHDASMQGLMQDWASVNAGHYAYSVTQGDLDVAFDRAATWLRRPTAYAVTARATFEVPATPTPTPEPTATPAPSPTLTPTPAPPAGPGTLRVVAPEPVAGQPAPAPVAGGAVELILDTSGSMLQLLGDQPRIDVAKAALTDVVTGTIPPGTLLTLRVFGTEPDSCETTLAVPLGPLDPAAAAAQIAGIQAVNLVKTPLGASLAAVADDLAGVTGPKIVVLVTDGEETCGGDPAAAIRDLIAQGVDVRVNIVGFAVEDAALKARFAEWARLGNGTYLDAGDAAALGLAIARALAAPYRVLDAAGVEVATGVVGGEPARVPAGVYTVEVLGDPIQRYEGVVITPGMETMAPSENGLRTSLTRPIRA